MPKLEQKVTDVLRLAENIIAEHERNSFGQDTWHELFDLEIQSPIEQILYIALKVAAKVGFYDLADVHRMDGRDYVIGLGIYQQRVIDKYRVDFLVTYHSYPRTLKDGTVEQQERSVIAECDSQAFHERTEQERRYEKARDRHFAKKDIHVFHYTGAEIIADPFLKAAEVVSYVSGDDAARLYEAVRNTGASA